MSGIQEAEVRMSVGDCIAGGVCIVGGVKEPVIIVCNVPGRLKLICYSGDSML
jgi:hypothetical protein